MKKMDKVIQSMDKSDKEVKVKSDNKGKKIAMPRS